MLTMLGSPRRACDGLTRRETLRVGALSLFGSACMLPALLHAEQTGVRPGKAKSVILIYLLGGAATQDMYDLKPNAPSGVRCEFKPIPTSAPGIQVCEHLPKLAQWMHRFGVVRSVNHKAGCHNCLPSYTGHLGLMPDQHPRDSDQPSMGSVCEYLRQNSANPGDVPDYVYTPCWLGWGQAFRRAGPYAGFLGQRYNALTTECAPYADKGVKPAPGSPQIVRGEPFLPYSRLEKEMTIDRFSSRRTLLEQIDDHARQIDASSSAGQFDRLRERAFDLVLSSKVKSAFDLRNVDPRVLDRYGRHLFGHSTLIARRLVETGVRFINVTWDLFWDRVKIDYDAWDTHNKNFTILKENKLPGLDQTLTALLGDLQDRGLLDETLVVVTSEMGRTPRVNGNGGRDHWTYCYGSLFAGAGIRGGSVCGASDSQAAYVKDRPVSPADICATIYHCLGIDSDMTVPDRAGRPVPVALGGQPIREILA